VTAPSAPVTVWFFRHGEVSSHRGDVPLTERGTRDAEAAGERLADALEPAAQVSFLHAPTQRTLQTLEAIRRGLIRRVPAASDVEFGVPRVEAAIRNPDLFVAGTRVEMVSSVEALAEQLPDGALSLEELARHAFFARFWARADRIRVWLDDDDPPGERRGDVARRFFSFARSLTDGSVMRPHHHVCVTHSGPLRALVLEFVQAEDPGEPEYVEPVCVRFAADRAAAEWRFRGIAERRTITS
jgi:broad specificity phosphatase PhoE